jgi:hypothetical protein
VFKRMSRVALTVSVVAFCGVVAPAVAGAAAVYVSNSAPVVVNGKSCAQPRYSTIQAALNAEPAGAIIDVCPGTYAEQLTVVKRVKLTAAGTAGSAKITLPAVPTNTKTPCDEAPGTESFQPDQDALSICATGNTTLTGLTFESNWPEGTCNDSLFSILVAGGANLKATNVTINGAGASPINGCQGGVGMQIGMAWTTPVQVAHAKLTGVTVTGYQKNGISVDGTGSTAAISKTTVTGAGATPEIAQNGIQVANGAQAKIKSSTISGNECDHASCGADAFSEYQAIGVLFYGAAAGSSVTSSKISGNDIGTYYYSTSPTQPSSPEVTLSKDVFTGNRYEGIVLDQGNASIKSDTISGPGNIGIDLFQYEGQAYAPDSTGSSLHIEGQSQAGVKVESDKQPGDLPGKFVLTKSTFSGNGTVLDNESSNFEVVF